MNIISAVRDKALLRPFFKDLSTWRAWFVFLRALFGLPIEDAGDLELFRSCTGLEIPPSQPSREAFVIAGRRSGKSFMSAVIAAYLAAFFDWRPYLAPGEIGWIFIVATDKAQAAVIKNYISGIFHGNRSLKLLVENETKETIELKNRVTISVKTCSFRTIRGYTVLAAVMEELAFWRSEESANPDKEILAAVRPALATIPESLLIGISTPYSRSGVLFDQFRSNYGKAGGPLVWKAATAVMNPTIKVSLIEKAIVEDPEAARAEWLAEWRQDISAFLPEEIVRSVVIPGRYELPKIADVQYHGFADPSGGRQDSFCLGISHREKSGRIVLDVLRERVPPFKPEAVVEEYCGVLASYGVSEIQADRYAGEWVTSAFKKFGIEVKAAELTASELYLETLPLITQGAIEILDNRRLVSQLAGLERRTRSGGKDMIAHYPGGHDDCANAAAGALVMAVKSEAGKFYGGFTKHAVYGDGDEGPGSWERDEGEMSNEIDRVFGARRIQ